MKNLVFLLEEPSAKEMLLNIVPQIINEEIDVRYIVFEGKQDLEKQIEKKLRGYNTPDAKFIIMRDQDSGDCKLIKNSLLTKIDNAGKKECSLVRIACHELESFYLGDLAAVEKGLAINGLSKHQTKRYKEPDTLANAAEELFKLTKDEYQKIAGSRAISQYLNIDGRNKSTSFNILVEGIKKMTGGGDQ